jgi:hypothetical protein
VKDAEAAIAEMDNQCVFNSWKIRVEFAKNKPGLTRDFKPQRAEQPPQKYQ